MWNSTFRKPSQPLKRSQIRVNVADTTLAKARKPMTSHGKKPPTVEERAWMAFVAEFGCVVCWLKHNVKTPCAVHHIVEGGRRVGHLFTIGLCDPGHHQGTPDKSIKISRHPDKARFEAAYGDEYELHSYLLQQYELTMGLLK